MIYILKLENGELYTITVDNDEHLENLMGDNPLNKQCEIYAPKLTSGALTYYTKRENIKCK